MAQITRIRVRETVPDSLLNKADDIEVIDISPDELIQRLKEERSMSRNKQSAPSRITSHPAILPRSRTGPPPHRSARRWAASVSHAGHAIPGRGRGRAAARLRSEDPRSAGLVRYTKRLADRLHAPWTAVYIESRSSQQLSEVERDRVADTLRLAEKLQGEAVDPARRKNRGGTFSYSRANNVTQIVMGKSGRPRWFELVHGSVVNELVRGSGNITVHVIAGEHLTSDPIPKKTVKTREIDRV